MEDLEIVPVRTPETPANPSATRTKFKYERRAQQRAFATARLCVPIMATPGLWSFDAWLNLYGHYLYGMLDFIDRAFTLSLETPMGYVVYIDRDALYRKLLRYVYHNSINRCKAYTAIQ